MARTGPLHWVGVLFILAASICLLISTISAPVINDISMLKVTLTNSSVLRHSSVTFGTFGHCVLDVAPKNTDQDYCTGKHIGYKPAVIMSQIEPLHFSAASSKTADGLTSVMVLHPIACGVSFVAFLLSLGAGVIGSLFGAAVAAIAFIITLVVMAVDFTLFGIIRKHVNRSGSGIHARYGVGMWTVLAAMILLFFGMFIVLFTCFSARKQKKRDRASYKTETTTTTRKRRFWQRRQRGTY